MEGPIQDLLGATVACNFLSWVKIFSFEMIQNDTSTGCKQATNLFW